MPAGDIRRSEGLVGLHSGSLAGADRNSYLGSAFLLDSTLSGSEPKGRIRWLLTKKAGTHDDRPLTVYKPYVPIYRAVGQFAHNMWGQDGAFHAVAFQGARF